MFKNVEFQDIEVLVEDRFPFGRRRRKRALLKGTSGVFKQGQLTGIMGSSGAGKSTLLNTISGYRSRNVSGTIKINRKRSCYLTQDDLHQPQLTVQELMDIACELKTEDNDIDRDRLITDILTGLNLNHRRGNTSKQLSGGERKRLSIGLEMVSNPSIFFLDEPTTGLDEVTAAQCVHLLRELAHQNHTVVCTIHQPSSAMFKLFDHIYVLAAGHCVYQGSPDALVEYLSSLINAKCPTNYNPADYIIELCDADPSLIPRFAELTQNGKLSATSRFDEALGKTVVEMTAVATSMLLDQTVLSPPPVTQSLWGKVMSLRRYMESEYSRSSIKQFCVLVGMINKKIYRNRIGVYISAAHHIICGFMIGLIFLGAANDGNRMFDHLKFCIGVVFFISYTQVIIPVLNYPEEVKLVKKECFNRWYGITPYYAALTVCRIPLQVLFNLIFLALCYCLPGLPFEWWRFVLFSFVGLIISLVAEGLGLAIGATFSVTNGCAAGPLFLAPLLGLAIYGFDFAAEISMLMYGIMKASFIRGGVVALVLVVFGYNRQRLDCNDVYCHFDDPQVLLRYLRVEKVSLATELAFLIGIMIFFRVLLYVSLRNRTKA